MGTVWLCHDEVLGRDVAVKQVGVLPGESAPDLARALREARSSAALNHPSVVSVFDAVEEGDHIWLVMEYVPGTTLSELVAREGPLSPERVAHIGAQVADGLAAAHARGTVHRDVKPGNVLVGPGDVAKIGDFGIARSPGDPQVTASGLLTGTPLYFSPDLARGADPSPADDVWALGATLYTAVEGEPPIADRGNAIATLTAIAESRPRQPRRAGFLTDALGRMLDPDAGSRWSMADAAHALRRLHERHQAPGTLEATARRPEPTTPVVEKAPVERRRGRWPLLVGVLVLLLLAGTAAAVLVRQYDDDPSASPTGRRSDSSVPPPETATATETATVTATSDPTEESSETAPPATSSDPEQAVVDYYALLPDDTEDAWAMLGPGARSDAQGYDNYAGFWSGISSVQVDGTSIDGDVVSVDLTYDGDDSETRRLRMASTSEGWIIADDLGTS